MSTLHRRPVTRMLTKAPPTTTTTRVLVWSGRLDTTAGRRHKKRRAAARASRKRPSFCPSAGRRGRNIAPGARPDDPAWLRDRGRGDTHRRRGWMVADFGPSFSLTPQAFTPTTWRLGGGAGESAACREGMRESVRFIAPTGRGGTAAPAPVPLLGACVCVRVRGARSYCKGVCFIFIYFFHGLLFCGFIHTDGCNITVGFFIIRRWFVFVILLLLLQHIVYDC